MSAAKARSEIHAYREQHGLTFEAMSKLIHRGVEYVSTNTSKYPHRAVMALRGVVPFSADVLAWAEEETQAAKKNCTRWGGTGSVRLHKDRGVFNLVGTLMAPPPQP